MYFYACPYCWDASEPRKEGSYGKLIVIKSAEATCDHKKGLFRGEKECKKDKYKCREVMHCTVCGCEFAKTDEFLKAQKRKIKDG